MGSRHSCELHSVMNGRVDKEEIFHVARSVVLGDTVQLSLVQLTDAVERTGGHDWELFTVVRRRYEVEFDNMRKAMDAGDHGGYEVAYLEVMKLGDFLFMLGARHYLDWLVGCRQLSGKEKWCKDGKEMTAIEAAETLFWAALCCAERGVGRSMFPRMHERMLSQCWRAEEYQVRVESCVDYTEKLVSGRMRGMVEAGEPVLLPVRVRETK